MDSVSRTFTIGELARRTGLPVKTIRFYSDEGLLPPTDRTHSGYRLYDTRSLARLELIRTLRELGLGLADVALVLADEVTVPQLASRHIEALDEQIRRLRVRRAVLRAVVNAAARSASTRGGGRATGGRKSELEEVKLMNKLASMSDEERVRLLDEFWAEITEGLTIDSEFYAMMRSAKPNLPDDPTPEQVEAWVEFAELIQDPDFHQVIRGMSERQSASLEAGEHQQPADAMRESWSDWSNRAQAHLDAGLAPTSAEGQALAEEILAASGSPDRGEFAERVTASTDARAERYWQLLAIMNGWPPIPSTIAAAEWIAAALRG